MQTSGKVSAASHQPLLSAGAVEARCCQEVRMVRGPARLSHSACVVSLYMVETPKNDAGEGIPPVNAGGEKMW